MSREESLRILEESYEKREWDVFSRIESARKEGLLEGEARGEARGDFEGTLRVARAALLKGMSIELVMDITGLDATTLKQLQEN
jgi:predicted transposase YdaD